MEPLYRRYSHPYFGIYNRIMYEFDELDEPILPDSSAKAKYYCVIYVSWTLIIVLMVGYIGFIIYTMTVV